VQSELGLPQVAVFIRSPGEQRLTGGDATSKDASKETPVRAARGEDSAVTTVRG
jgi:hypothetical protein